MSNKFKKLQLAGLAAILGTSMAACSNNEASVNDEKNEASAEETAESGMQSVTYLEKEYEIPKEPQKIAIASLESLEDAAMLDVKPAAAVTSGGELPDYTGLDMEGVEPIGDRKEPNLETLLSVQPDVILWTSKSDENVTQQLEKIAPTFPYSHVSENWESNLRLMGELTGKEQQAEDVIGQYKKDVENLRSAIGEEMADKKVAMVRIRGGNIFIYPESVYFNPVLYGELGLSVPDEVKAAEAQEMLSLEQLAEMNPDYLYVQFAEEENADQPKALEDLQNNPIWQSIQASKDNHVYVNAVNDLAQGGTAWSKTQFLEAVKETIAK